MNGGYLVTGGAGFIGSNLVRRLAAQGARVRVFDNLSSGHLENLAGLEASVEFVQGDLRDAAAVQAAARGVRNIFHVGALASVQASVDDPVSTHQSNFVGTLNICEAMREAGVRRVLFASSAAVYGNNGEGVAVTEDTPKAPLTPYASDKLASEYYLDFYRRQHGLEPAIFRFFNIFGPRQDPSSPYSGVISIFTERALAGRPITVFGDGEQTRDFFYIDDLVPLLVQGLFNEGVQPGAVNVGHSQSVSLNQLLEAVRQVLGSLPQVTYGEARAGDIRHSRADSTLLRQRFQLGAATPLAQGLAQLLGR